MDIWIWWSRRRYICFSTLARARNFCRVFYSFMLLHKNCLPTQKRFERLKPIDETFLLLTTLRKNIYLLLHHTSASIQYLERMYFLHEAMKKYHFTSDVRKTSDHKFFSQFRGVKSYFFMEW